MKMNKKTEKVLEIREVFREVYGDAKCSLIYEKPHELLFSTMLSAQCTDARVNIVTKDLYQKYPTLEAFAEATLEELEKDIYTIGFYHNKAKNIILCANRLLEAFDGRVPDNMDDLLTLPGVGRKTANLILGDLYGRPSLVIDTHAKRLTNRIGLVKEDDVTKIEFLLRDIVPPDYQTEFCHQLVWHGRAVCTARAPRCGACPILHLCARKL